MNIKFCKKVGTGFSGKQCGIWAVIDNSFNTIHILTYLSMHRGSFEDSMESNISKKRSDKLVIAAIDLGTTYSGYAYTLKHELEKPRSAEEMCQVLTHNWQSGSSAGLISHKTPTSLLLEKDGTFHSFGYKAEKKYTELAGENKHKGWKFFRKFKMMLHKNEVHLIFS